MAPQDDAPGKRDGHRRRLTPEKGITMSLDAAGTSRNATPTRVPPYVRFPKQLLDAVMGSEGMSPAAKLLVLAAYRWTHGHYQHPEAHLAVTYLQSYCRVSERTVRRNLELLIREGVLIEKKRPTRTEPRILAVQRDPQKWGKYAPAQTGPVEPPSPVEACDEERTSSPVEGSDGEWTSSPPKDNAHKDFQDLEEEERAEASGEETDDEEDFPFFCEAEAMLTEVDSSLVEAVGRAKAREVYRRMCDYCDAASPDLYCADRADVCVTVAEALDARLTRKDIKNKVGYLAKVLKDDDTSPGDLIGSAAYWTLNKRNGPWPR